jgi:hypothetical protein
MRKTPFAAAALLGGAVLLSVPAVSPAFAQPAGGPPGPQQGTGGPPRGQEALFAEIDANKDGRATWEEVWVFVQQRFGRADTDRSGALSQAELQSAMPAGGPRGGRPAGDAPGPRGERRAEMLGAMFRALDANRDGQVTLEEVRPAVEARFRAADANGDNAVARDELPSAHSRGGPRGSPGGGGDPTAPANPG